MSYVAEQVHVTMVTSRPHLYRSSPHAQPLGASELQVRREDEQCLETGDETHAEARRTRMGEGESEFLVGIKFFSIAGG